MDKVKILDRPIGDVVVLESNMVEDERGSFLKLYESYIYGSLIDGRQIQQINISRNNKKGTIRGMHFQASPSLELKIVRCIGGKILDVIIDVRKGSPTFGETFELELSEKNNRILVIPEGFAHGYQTLEDNSEVFYIHTGPYDPKSEDGIRFDDPLFSISWPLEPTHLSEKDFQRKFKDSTFNGISV